MANSADPYQLASSEANRSGSTQFAKQGISRLSRTRVNIEIFWASVLLYLAGPDLASDASGM